MIEIGTYHTLKISRDIGKGLYLAHEWEDEPIFLPRHEAPKRWEIGDELEVFVYKDNHENFVATTKTPKIKLNEFAYLRVKHIGDHGAFLDWGLDKDLFVPYRQQAKSMVEGKSYIVLMFLDDYSNRLVGSTKYNWFFEQQEMQLRLNEEVELLIADPTDIGINVIINHQYKGLLYKSELFKNIRKGEVHTGYVKNIREDGKVDVSLRQQGYGHIESNQDVVLSALQKNGGFLPLNDKSSPEAITQEFGISKKSFKKMVGALYKQRKIRIETDGIYLVDE